MGKGGGRSRNLKGGGKKNRSKSTVQGPDGKAAKLQGSRMGKNLTNNQRKKLEAQKATDEQQANDFRQFMVKVNAEFAGCTIKQVGVTNRDQQLCVTVHEREDFLVFEGAQSLMIRQPDFPDVTDKELKEALELVCMDVPIEVIQSWSKKARYNSMHYASLRYLTEHPPEDAEQIPETPACPAFLSVYEGTFDPTDMIEAMAVLGEQRKAAQERIHPPESATATPKQGEL